MEGVFSKQRAALLMVLAVLAVHVSLCASSTVGFAGDFFPIQPEEVDGGGELLFVGDEEAVEFQMDSEINRRILATRRYISYGALRRNSVPCSRRGASYYNCRRGAQANPYSRGCSAITRCRR